MSVRRNRNIIELKERERERGEEEEEEEGAVRERDWYISSVRNQCLLVD